MSTAIEALTQEAATLAVVLHQEQITELAKGINFAAEVMRTADRIRRETLAHVPEDL